MARLFDKKQTKDSFWRQVEYVQTCVKDMVGIGKLITVNFYAPIDFATGKIDYEKFKAMPDEIELLETGEWQEYARK